MKMRLMLLTIFFAFAMSGLADSTINESNKYAYAANAGWINCRGDVTNGAVIGEFVCSNYLYGANIGWIHLGDGNPTNGYQYSNISASDYGVNHDGQGNLRGYAWAGNIGWIVFETNGAPTIDLQTGILSGYAWGGNIGWISLSNAQAYVLTDTINTGPDLDTDGIPDMWEYQQTDGTNTLGAGHDEDEDGVLDVNEYVAGTDPQNSNDYLRITQIAVTSSTNAQLTWASDQTRLYRIDKSGSLTNAAGWMDSGLGLQSPDAGSTTTKTAPGEVATQRFFRVKAVRPRSE